jgi:type IV pilus assembly protein PilV
MDMSENNPGKQSQGGVVLIEVLIAILIFAIGVLAVVGLQAAAIANVADSKYRLGAASVANQQIARMWVDQANLSLYAGSVSVPDLPNGNLTTTVVGSAVTVAVTWQPPNAGTAHTFNTVARIYGN